MSLVVEAVSGFRLRVMIGVSVYLAWFYSD